MKKQVLMSALVSLAAMPAFGADQLFSQTAAVRAAPAQARALNHEGEKLQGLKFDAKLMQAQSLIIPLPNGKSVEAQLSKRYVNKEGFTVWAGKHSSIVPNQQNVGNEETILVMRDGAVYGNIRHDGASYKIRFDKSGLHSVEQISKTQAVRDHDEVEYSSIPSRTYQELKRIDDASLQAARLNAFAGKVLSPSGKFAPAPAAAPSGKVVIRVLVNYTAKVKAQAEISNPGKGMDFVIAESIAVTNIGYANSGVNAELVLAHKAEVSYVETGDISNSDKPRYKTKGDGFMDEIHTQRDQYAADVGILFVNSGSVCGSASAIGAVESDSFAVVKLSCAVDNLSFPHELGHLYGARHDIQQDTKTTPFAFGHGYISPDKKWRTVMAYDNCGGCVRLNYWSNPQKTYNAFPMGIVGSSDNAQVLNLRASALAAFRPELTTDGNKAPVVNAGTDQTVRIPALANLSATASDDGLPAGSSLTHAWTKVSGPGTVTVANAGALATTASFSAAGTYVLRLTSSDSTLSSSDDVTVSVSANKAPVANFTSTSNALTVQFTDASTDSDGTIASRSWNFGDGTSSTLASPSHVYVSAGTYTITLTVTDNEGLTHTKTATLPVSVAPPANQAPVANFSSSVTGATATFTDNSTDADGTVSSWLWNFGDGTTSTLKNPSKTYTTTANYNVTLTVKDNLGVSSTAVVKSLAVTVPVVVIPEGPWAQATSGGNKMDIKSGLRGAQSFKYGTTGSYAVNKLTLYISRSSTLPNAGLVVSIGTSANGGTLANSTVTLPASSVTNTSGGSTFQKVDITLPASLNLNPGVTYFINISSAASNDTYYIEAAGTSSYANGSYFKNGSDEKKDLRFAVSK